jgi:ABC-type dipeptide/oligopeptide/nickel transport system ATPase subunit
LAEYDQSVAQETREVKTYSYKRYAIRLRNLNLGRIENFYLGIKRGTTAHILAENGMGKSSVVEAILLADKYPISVYLQRGR